MNIIKAFNKAFKAKKENNWEKIYVLVDIHDTIMEGTKPEGDTLLWYESALEALQMMTNRDDICLIMWTGAYSSRIKKYIWILKSMGIVFDYLNENPEADSNEYYCQSNKIYFNIGIDDRFGFEPEEDWKKIIDFLKINGGKTLNINKLN